MTEQHESFRAMDTDIDLLIIEERLPFDAGLSIRLLFEQQEERFSRFRTGSLLSRLNRGETISDARFATACALALKAHEATDGLYNPMVLPALEQAGYSKTFRDVSGGDPQPRVVPDPNARLVIEGNSVRLREGGLDLGGIVKGWTVDLGVELLASRYPNTFLNAGGDIRCCGADDGGDGWLIAIDNGTGEGTVWEGNLHGAVATSSTRKRRWRTDSGKFAHHLIDPRTGLPADSPFEQVTTWAPDCWRAETWAKAVLIGGEEAAEAAAGAGQRIVTIDIEGRVRHWGTA
jgi:thiamine biosynthesis lipoprotein